MNLINIIPALVFLFLLLINLKKVGRFFALSNFIYALYFFSTISFYIYSLYDKDYYYNLDALILIVISNVFLISPLSSFEKHSNLVLSDLNVTKFKIISLILIILGLYAVIYFGGNIGKIFIYGATYIRSSNFTLYDSGSLSSLISIFGTILSPISMFFGFYNLSKKILNNKITLLLFISSMSVIFRSLGVAGRDGMVIWLFCFLGLICFFYPYLKRKILKQLKWVVICFVIAVTPIFMFITNDRFSGTAYGRNSSMYSYLGQSLYNLSYNIDNFKKTGLTSINYRNHLGLFYKIYDGLLGNNVNDLVKENIVNSNGIGYVTNIFSFYIGDFYPFLTHKAFFIFFILLCYWVYRNNLKVHDDLVISTTRLLIAYSWYMILIFGIFYFYYGNQYGNTYLIIPFILRIALISKIGIDKY